LTPGSYEVWVHAATAEAVGVPYTFAVSVAPIETFDVAVGDSIRPDQPAPGAGTISTIGERDRYTFTLTAPATLLFDAEETCNNPPTGDGGYYDFDHTIYRNGEYWTYVDICYPEPEVFYPGTYTLEVNYWGYWEVPPPVDYWFTIVDLAQP
jgi:hypothetical protein